MASPQFVSDREQEILDAVSNLATRNPFEPARIENEQRALGEAFVKSAEVWHMDADLLGINPNIASLSELVERFAETLRTRLGQGARATPTQLWQYEGLVFYLLFYRYAGSMTEMIEALRRGAPRVSSFTLTQSTAATSVTSFRSRELSFPLRPTPTRRWRWVFRSVERFITRSCRSSAVRSRLRRCERLSGARFSRTISVATAGR